MDTDRKVLRNDQGDIQSYKELYPTTYNINTEHLQNCVNCNEATLRCHAGVGTTLTANQMETSMEQLTQASKTLNKTADNLAETSNMVKDTIRDNAIAKLQKEEWYRNLSNKQKAIVTVIISGITSIGTLIGAIIF